MLRRSPLLALTYGVRQPSVTADPLTYRIGPGVVLRNIPGEGPAGFANLELLPFDNLQRCCPELYDMSLGSGAAHFEELTTPEAQQSSSGAKKTSNFTPTETERWDFVRGSFRRLEFQLGALSCAPELAQGDALLRFGVEHFSLPAIVTGCLYLCDIRSLAPLGSTLAPLGSTLAPLGQL